MTVFRSAAVVERVATLSSGDIRGDVTGDSGTSAVRIENLPLSLDDGSVRVSLEPLDSAPGSSAEVPWIATDSRVVLAVPERRTEAIPAQDSDLESARLDLQRLKSLLSVYETACGRIHSLDAPARPRSAYGTPPPEAPSDARLALLDFSVAELSRLHQRISDTKVEIDDATERLQELEERRRRASSSRQAREHELRKSVIVGLRSVDGVTDLSSEVACRLVVSYSVPGARWAPGYEARFDGDLHSARLSMRALVSQSSGEDWSNVKLTVSTAEPSSWSELPELRSLRIGRRQPRPVARGWRSPPKGTSDLFEDYRRGLDAARTRLQSSPGGNEAGEAGRIPDATAAVAVSPMISSPAAERDLDDTRDRSFSGILEGAPAGGMALMAEAPAPQAKMARRTRQPASERVRGGAPEKRARRPAPKKAAKKKAPKKESGGSEAGMSMSGTLVSDELLDYGALRLSSVDHVRRGCLVSGSRDEAYLELLVQQSVEIRLNVRTVLDKAVRRAKSASKPVPQGYSVAPSWKGFDHAYTSEGAIDVPSDGAFHNIPLLDRSAKSRPRYVIVPRESSEAFRIVDLENPLNAPLPAGPVEIYVADNFLLTSSLDVAAQGASVELGLGVDEAVKVARNTDYEEQTTGIVRGRLGLEHEVRVEIANPHRKSIECEVRERLPFTQKNDEAVEVEVLETEPSWEAYEQASMKIRGSHRWRVHVEPGSKRLLRLRYVVRLSSKLELIGGNRRER